MCIDTGRDASAFTLVEVMLVIFLLGIILAVAVPSIDSTADEMKINAAAQEVVYAVQYVQDLSIKEGAAYGVKFEGLLDKFSCYKYAGNVTIRHPIDKKLYVIDFSGEGHLKGVDISSTTFSGNKVVFSSLGEPAEGGSVVIAYAGFQKTINIAAITGKVSVN